MAFTGGKIKWTERLEQPHHNVVRSPAVMIIHAKHDRLNVNIWIKRCCKATNLHEGFFSNRVVQVTHAIVSALDVVR